LLIEKDSIVISSRAPIGYCAIVDKEFTTNQGCKSITLDKENDSDFYYYNIIKNIHNIKIRGEGTTFMEISKKELEKINFKWCDKLEQKLISEKLLSIDQKLRTEQEALLKYQQLKSGLMGDLLSGKVEVN
jgi:type I restriction enzyme S subunit